MVLNTKDGIVYNCDGTPTDDRFDTGVGENVVFSPCLGLGNKLWDYAWHIGNGLFVWSSDDSHIMAQIAVDHIDYAMDVARKTKRSVFVVTQGQDVEKLDVAICYGKQWLTSMESTHFLLVDLYLSRLQPSEDLFTYVGISGAYTVYHKIGHTAATIVGLEEVYFSDLIESLLSLIYK